MSVGASRGDLGHLRRARSHPLTIERRDSHGLLPDARRWWPEALVAGFVALPVLLRGGAVLNADTKLFLTSDPGGLMSAATQSWDASQFGGYVPHQAVAYLWPTGPFHWLARQVGVSPWFAQRLFVALLFALAAVGVARFLRRVGFTALPVFVGSLVYATSPYVLAYQSRTSAMLLPWAGLGWMCLCVRRGLDERSWRWPAALALLLGTAGAVNGAAVLLVLPAVVIVALVPLGDAEVSLRARIGLLVRAAALTIACSAWWIAAVAVQARHGADVLTYSETLEDVASTSNAFEVLRGFGYWLNYVGLDGTPATTAARDIIASRLSLAATMVAPAVALWGLVRSPGRHARLGAALVLVGLVVAVGPYPLGEPSLFGMPLAENPDSWMSLALRSSTRALPVLLIGCAIGAALACSSGAGAALVRLLPASRSLAAPLIVGVVVVGAVVAHPGRWRDGAVDAQISRPTEVPGEWLTAVAAAEDRTAASARILQLPGQEFGAYEWGFTLDPLLAALTSRQILTRDLLPLGAPQMMDLLWAVDDAGREGRLSPESLPEIGRLLGASTLFVPGDLDSARYHTPTAAEFLDINGLRESARPSGVHSLVSLGSSGSVLRQQAETVIVAGSGKGLVDAAGRGLIGGATVRFAGDIDDADLRNAISGSKGLLITDTHTDEARHWRGSRDTLGFAEASGGATSPLLPATGDRRLPLFSESRDGDRTWFEQEGGPTARASAYGETIFYRPEDRPFRAVDGDPTTAWRVGRRGDARGQMLELTFRRPVDHVIVIQPGAPANRRITEASVSVDGGSWTPVELSESSVSVSGQRIDLVSPGTRIRLRIDETRPIPDTDRERGVDGVGFAEVVSTAGHTREVGVLASRAQSMIEPDTPIAVLLTRRRAPEWDPDRAQPETAMHRRLQLPQSRSLDLVLGVSPAAVGGRTPQVTVAGRPVEVEPADIFGSWRSISPVSVPAGPVDIVVGADGPVIDWIEMRDPRWSGVGVAPRLEELSGTGATRRTEIGACDGPCWLVFGEGFNGAWQATLGGERLSGGPVPVDGGGNGWFFPDGHGGGTLELRFAPQRQLSAALVLSAIAALACFALLLGSRRRREEVAVGPVASTHRSGPALSLLRDAVVFGACALALTFPHGLAVGLGAAVLARVLGHRRLAALGFVVTLGASVWAWWVIARDQPRGSFLWPRATDHLHGPILAGVILLACGVILSTASADRGTRLLRDASNTTK